jgi:hypothetical protein
VQPASEIHRQMLSAAASFDHPQRMAIPGALSDADRSKVLDVLSSEVRDRVDAILRAGRHIPEEVLA